MKKNDISKFIIIILILAIGYFSPFFKEKMESYSISNIPDYSGEDYIYINNNEPEFNSDLLNSDSFESYSNLDELNRAGVALANLSVDLMPTEERERLYYKPSGWNGARYDFIDENNLFNRCHLIAYQLTGENNNEKNLITCTRNMNADVMNSFEKKIGNYIRKTKNHVLYRVTPIYEGNNLVAKGVELEALSIEDNGKGIKYNVFIYNVQDGVEINYKNGENKKV